MVEVAAIVAGAIAAMEMVSSARAVLGGGRC